MDDNNNISNQERQRQEIKNLLSKHPSSSSENVKTDNNNNNNNNNNKKTSIATTTTPNTTSNTTTNATTSIPPPTNAATTTTATTTPTTNVTNNINNTSQPQLREDKLKLAVSFLSSPKVQTAEKAKKTAFLKQKGLTDHEIEEAYKRTDGQTTTQNNNNKLPANNQYTPSLQQQQPSSSYTSSVTSSLAPIVPTRPPVTRPIQIVYYSAAEPERLSIKKMIALALFFGIGTVGLTSSLLGIVKKCISPIFKSIYQYQSDRYNDRQHKIIRLNDILKEQWNESDNHNNNNKNDDDNDDDSINNNTSVLVSNGWWSPIISEQKNLLERIDKVVKRSQKYIDEDNEPYGKFKNVLLGFKDVITKPEYNYTAYTPYSVYGSSFSNRSNTGFDDDAVQGVKSEIRSFKGMLLSRRNFPKTQIKPSILSTATTTATTTTTSSAATTITSTSTSTTDNNNNNNVSNTPSIPTTITEPVSSSLLPSSSSSSSNASQAYHPRQRESQSFRSELQNKSFEAKTSSVTTTTAPESNHSVIDKGKGKEIQKSSVTVEDVKESSDDN